MHPVYFGYPYRHADEITIELQPGWQTNAVPKPRAVDINVTSYASSAQATGGTLNIKRELTLNTILVKLQHYPQLRDFFQAVRAGDEDQIVITPGPARNETPVCRPGGMRMHEHPAGMGRRQGT